MRQKLILYMLTLLTLLVLVVSVEADNTDDQILEPKFESPEDGATAADFSADYKQGFEEAAELYKPLATMDGMLQGTKILLDAFEELRTDGGFAGTFASGFLEVSAPAYNEEVTDYNELVALMNFMIDMRMGPGHDDLKFELAPFFY